VEVYTLASHVHWALWGIISVSLLPFTCFLSCETF
jgi:hypothetical protein